MNKLDKSKGFTLVELLVAMGIISLIVLAFFQVINSTIRGNEKTEKDIQMMDVAQIKIENTIAEIRNPDEDGNIYITVDNKNNKVNIDTLFTKEKNIYKEKYDYKYKDNISEYEVELNLGRSKISSHKVLENSYRYDIEYTVNQKGSEFTKRKINLATSIISIK